MRISDTEARELVPHVKVAIEAEQQHKAADFLEAYWEIEDFLDSKTIDGLDAALESAAADIAPFDAETAVTPTFVQQLFAPLKSPLTDAECEAQDAERRRERNREDADVLARAVAPDFDDNQGRDKSVDWQKHGHAGWNTHDGVPTP